MLLLAIAILEEKKYWECKLRIGDAKFHVGVATAISKEYEVSPLHGGRCPPGLQATSISPGTNVPPPP